MIPVLPLIVMKCVLNLSAGSATTFRRVRSKPIPARDSTAAMLTFAGKWGTPSRAVPAHGVVGGGFDDDLGARRDQLGRSDDEGHAELACESLAARSLAAPRYRDDLRIVHLASPRVLEEEPRDDPAAEEADPHVSRA